MRTQGDQLAVLVAACDTRILEVARPMEPEIQRLQTIVAVGRRSAEVMVSEIGVDMSRFATSGHLASWARICPDHESAGNVAAPGPAPATTGFARRLLESAWAASHARKSYLGAQYRRISKRRGPKRAAIAVAHTIPRHRLPRSALTHHSDRGSQYASHDYRALLGAEGIVCSMSRRGNCWDNAVVESFFGTLKTELAEITWPTRAAAVAAVTDYIDVFYNRRRRHSSLGYISPVAFELQQARCHAAA